VVGGAEGGYEGGGGGLLSREKKTGEAGVLRKDGCG